MGQGFDPSARRRNGTTFPVEISLNQIELGGNLVAVAFVSSSTERKQAEESLRKSESFFGTRPTARRF
jgi:PAS domain S-box-containing protein